MKKYLLLFLLLFSFDSSNACSCILIETFCETIGFGGNGIYESTDIFHGRVISKNQDEMIVEVIRVLHGDPALSTVNIINGFGADCRMGNHRFNTNEQFIFATNFYNGVYSLTDCGVPFLQVSGNTVSGKVAPGINSTTINQLLNVAGCPEFKLNIEFEVFPNPSIENSSFSLELKNEADIKVTVYNAAGQRVYQEAWEAVTSLTKEFPFADFPSGVYIVQLKAFDNTFYRKMIKS